MADCQISYDPKVDGTNGYLSAINTNGNKYVIKDTAAREATISNANQIKSLLDIVEGGVHYRGATTTALKDGDTTNPIMIGDKSYTAVAGDIVLVSNDAKGNIEFVFDGAKWQRLGSMEGLGELAWKNSATGKVTPKTTVGVSNHDAYTIEVLTSDFTFAGTKADLNATVNVPGQTLTGAIAGTEATLQTEFHGQVSTLTVTFNNAENSRLTELDVTPTFEGAEINLAQKATFNCTNGYAQSNLALIGTNSLDFTPVFTGNLSTLTANVDVDTVTPTAHFSGTSSTIQITNFDAFEISSESYLYTPAGNVSKPDITVTEKSAKGGVTTWADEVLTITFNDVISGATAALDKAPEFTGDAAKISANCTPMGKLSVEYTPSGNVTVDSFAPGVTATVEVRPTGTISKIEYTPTGHVVLPAYTPTGTVTGTFTPSGSISRITYRPTGSTTVSYTPVGTIDGISYTPAGSVSLTSEAKVCDVDFADYTPAGSVSGTVRVPEKQHTVSVTNPELTVTVS